MRLCQTLQKGFPREIPLYFLFPADGRGHFLLSTMEICPVSILLLFYDIFQYSAYSKKSNSIITNDRERDSMILNALWCCYQVFTTRILHMLSLLFFTLVAGFMFSILMRPLLYIQLQTVKAVSMIVWTFTFDFSSFAMQNNIYHYNDDKINRQMYCVFQRQSFHVHFFTCSFHS